MTSTTLSSDLTARLVRLFAQSGLIGEADKDKLRSRHSKRKDLVELLSQDVSMETFRALGASFRDVLTTEIRLPFGGRSSARDGETLSLGDRLGSVMDIRADEMLHMLTAIRPRLDYLVLRLIEAKVVDAEEIKLGVADAERMGEDPFEWLVRHDLMGPDALRRFLQSPDNPLVPRCALFLALWILRQNQLISEKLFDTLAQRVYSLRIEQALADVQKRIELTPSQLFEKIVEGMYLPDVGIADSAVDSELIAMFPASFLRRHLFLPLSRDDHRISLVVADPLNTELAVFVRWLTGKWVQSFFAPAGSLIDRINDVLGPTDAGEGNGRKAGAESRAGARSKRRAGKAAPKDDGARPPSAPRTEAKPGTRVTVARPADLPADSGSAVQLVSSMIEGALDLKATDIHLEPGRDRLTVRYRIDGVLTKVLEIPPALMGPVVSRIKVLANMDVTERRRPQDGHIMLELAERHFDFRIATMPTVFGEKMAVRILDSARVMTGLDQTGMNARQIRIARRLIHRPYGVLMVTGPTGSGKTSTLYSALHELNVESRHLVTIEDPVEYQLDGINQVQVDPHIGLGFSDGLRAILRQDPNVIMVGEIRDADTCKTAIRAALTGHLVLSTLHTNSAIGAIGALQNLGGTPYLIGSALTGVVAQRLVRKLCVTCRKTVKATAAPARQLGLKATASLRFPRAVGCEECLNLGYSGRTGIFEVLEITERLRGAILRDETPDALAQIADKDGRVSIVSAGVDKVREKITTPEEIVEKVILDS